MATGPERGESQMLIVGLRIEEKEKLCELLREDALEWDETLRHCQEDLAPKIRFSTLYVRAATVYMFENVRGQVLIALYL